MDDDDRYEFPMDTCEKNRAMENAMGIAQPYSVMVNLASCLMLGMILMGAAMCGRSWRVIGLVLGLLAFQSVHMFSHAIHIPGRVQVLMIHGISYGILLLLGGTLYRRYGMPTTSPILTMILIVLVMLDMGLIATGQSSVYFISSIVVIFVWLLILYYPRFNRQQRRLMVMIMVLSIMIVGALWNEKMNCRRMMAWSSEVPWHLIQEMVGAVVIVVMARFFILLEVRRHKSGSCRGLL